MKSRKKNEKPMEVILTSRPISLNPISWINAITRIRTRSPFDHVALKDNGLIYESVSGIGVQMIDIDSWKAGREGSYLFCYQIPGNYDVDIEKFWDARGKKYDYWANILFLFGAKHGLKKRSTKRYFCSELVATMLGMKEPYLYTPDDLEQFMRNSGWRVHIRQI